MTTIMITIKRTSMNNQDFIKIEKIDLPPTTFGNVLEKDQDKI